jgi:hypothetical protein
MTNKLIAIDRTADRPVANSHLLPLKVNFVFISLFCLVFLGCKVPSKKTSDSSRVVFLFNEKNLDKWRGDSRIWSVEEGCIVGRTTDENKIKKNTFLIYDTPYSDFELTFSYKLTGGNSGVQYRAKVMDEETFVVGGYQGDMEAGDQYSGILYEEKGRGILAKRGEQVLVDESGNKAITQFADSQEIQKSILKEDWNTYRIVANGNHLIHYINGQKTIDVMDKEIDKRASSGIIALQVHRGPNMSVYYKDIRLKILP